MKKNNKTLYGLILVTIAILFMFATLQSGFAADVPIDNTTTGGINGAITSSTTNPGDTILLNPGTYTGTNNTGITINKNVTIQGNGPTGSVIIDAEQQRRIFSIAANTNVTFINITFLNGMSSNNGGAIFNSGNLTVVNSTFTSNNATSGGAIANSGNVAVVNSTFTSNTVTSSGGAIRNGNGANITITNSTFIDNQANLQGGAIFTSGSSLYLSNNTMVGNTANSSGNVIYVGGEASVGVLNLTFIGNSTLITKIGSTITLYAILTDDMGNLVTGQNIGFYLNGVLYENIWVNEGLAKVNFTASKAGDITVSGEYTGIGDFDILINNGLLIVNKINVSSTIVVPENVTVGKEVNITGVATDEDGNPLANIDLTVTVDGKTYPVTTDSNGRWSLPYIPTHAGNIEASISWAGNDTHNGFNKSTNFNVAKRNIIVTITTTENPDGSVTVIANATYEDGSPAPGYPVDFLLDGKIIGTGVTDSNGIATLTIPANKISDGPHTISVVVIGDDNANDATASTEFTKTTKDNTTNKTNNKPTTTTAAMKNTGIPIIAIILLLLTGLGLVVKRKN